jgi:hypothetical protein
MQITRAKVANLFHWTKIQGCHININSDNNRFSGAEYGYIFTENSWSYDEDFKHKHYLFALFNELAAEKE